MIEDPEAVGVTPTDITNEKTCWNYVFLLIGKLVRGKTQAAQEERNNLV